MKEDIICTYKEIALTAEEHDRVLNQIRNNRLRIKEEKPHPEIIRKTSLVKYECLVIEHNIYSLYDSWGSPMAIGLADIKVDKERNELSGIRVLCCCGKYTFKRYIYNLDKYRKKWRAWTALPNHKQPWK